MALSQGRSIIFFYPPLEKEGQGGFESGENMSDMESIVIKEISPDPSLPKRGKVSGGLYQFKSIASGFTVDSSRGGESEYNNAKFPALDYRRRRDGEDQLCI